MDREREMCLDMEGKEEDRDGDEYIIKAIGEYKIEIYR